MRYSWEFFFFRTTFFKRGLYRLTCNGTPWGKAALSRCSNDDGALEKFGTYLLGGAGQRQSADPPLSTCSPFAAGAHRSQSRQIACAVALLEQLAFRSAAVHSAEERAAVEERKRQAVYQASRFG